MFKNFISAEPKRKRDAAKLVTAAELVTRKKQREAALAQCEAQRQSLRKLQHEAAEAAELAKRQQAELAKLAERQQAELREVAERQQAERKRETPTGETTTGALSPCYHITEEVRVIEGVLIKVDPDFVAVEYYDGGEPAVFATYAERNKMFITGRINQNRGRYKNELLEKQQNQVWGQHAIRIQLEEIESQLEEANRVSIQANEDFTKAAKKEHGPASAHPMLSANPGGNYGSIILETIDGDYGTQITTHSTGGYHVSNTMDLLKAFLSIVKHYSFIVHEVIAVATHLWQEQSDEERKNFLTGISKTGVKTLIIEQTMRSPACG